MKSFRDQHCYGNGVIFLGVGLRKGDLGFSKRFWDLGSRLEV